MVDELEKDVSEVEAEVFSAGRSNPTERIYGLKRQVLEFHRAVAGLVAGLDMLARGRHDLVPQPLLEYFRDVHDHLLHIVGRIETLREPLTGVLDANLAQVGVRQNEDVRKISAWVAILAVPTMIAGIYGMNFEHMPELESTLGYPVVVAVMLTACSGLYLYFKRAGWL